MDTPDTLHVPKPDLFAKIGPLPAWGWGLMVVAAYLGYRRFAAMRTPVAYTDPANLVTDASTPAEDSWNTSGGGGGGTTGVGPESSGYNYGDVLSGNYTGTTSGAVFSTNQQWAVYAITNLTRMGYPPGDVASAITFYLSGMPLTATQAQIIAVAIQNYGSPPLPLPVTSVADVPAAVTTPPATADPVATPTAPVTAPVYSAPVVAPTLPWHKDPVPEPVYVAPVVTAPVMTDQLRWVGPIDDKSRAILAAGGSVTRGNGYVYAMSGPNGTGVPVRIA